jgi:hypothetical protein
MLQGVISTANTYKSTKNTIRRLRTVAAIVTFADLGSTEMFKRRGLAHHFGELSQAIFAQRVFDIDELSVLFALFIKCHLPVMGFNLTKPNLVTGACAKPYFHWYDVAAGELARANSDRLTASIGLAEHGTKNIDCGRTRHTCRRPRRLVGRGLGRRHFDGCAARVGILAAFFGAGRTRHGASQ